MSGFRVGCPDCGNVMDFVDGVLCECDCELVSLDSAADVLAFKLRMSGRQDEAVGVEDRRAAMGEWAA